MRRALTHPIVIILGSIAMIALSLWLANDGDKRREAMIADFHRHDFEPIAPDEALRRAVNSVTKKVNADLAAGKMQTWQPTPIAKRLAAAFRAKGWRVVEDERYSGDEETVKFYWPESAPADEKSK